MVTFECCSDSSCITSSSKDQLMAPVTSQVCTASQLPVYKTIRITHLLIHLALLFSCVQSYKHVIAIHGIRGDPSEFNNITTYIQKYHPGTNITAIDLFNGVYSILPMWTQTNFLIRHVAKLQKEHPEGNHLLCFSQGGLLCRAIIEKMPDHMIHTFISLSCPQGGQFGDTAYLKYLFPRYIKENIYKLFYTRSGQEVSVANYWNDPHQQQLYLQYNVFLPQLNNQVLHPLQKAFRENFLRLKHLVLIGGPDDGVVTPWQSSHFAVYNEKEDVLEMRDQQLYHDDLFGLRTLDKRGAIYTYTIPGVEHVLWHVNETVFTCCIEPWLT